MSRFDYMLSRQVDTDVGFYPLLMALIRKADTENYIRLEHAFPDVCAELRARYDAPGGYIGDESRVLGG